MLRLLHRAAGVALALPLLAWIATGLAFHVKHRYGEAYEILRVPPAGLPRWDAATIAPGTLVTRGIVDGPVATAVHPRGAVAYFGSRKGQPVALDAATGSELEQAGEAEARSWAERAVAASAHRARYGSAGAIAPATHASALTGLPDPAFVVRFSGGKRVTLDRVTGEIAQVGDLNDFIDLTYRIHYLQWTPWQPLNVALVLAALPLVLYLAASGLSMAVKGRGRQSPTDR